MVRRFIGGASSVVNVGAGAGSYEPEDIAVIAVEPSAEMRSQRPVSSATVVNGVAEQLPFADRTFDAAMAMVTIHQWPDPEAGLRELRRVSRGRVVILTFDGYSLGRLWLGEYAPELHRAEARRYPPISWICEVLGGHNEVIEVPVPVDCVDGFTEAFYARPEAFLDPAVRRSQSAWGFVDDLTEARFAERLSEDLESGEWDARYGGLRDQQDFVGALRLIVSET